MQQIDRKSFRERRLEALEAAPSTLAEAAAAPIATGARPEGAPIIVGGVTKSFDGGTSADWL